MSMPRRTETESGLGTLARLPPTFLAFRVLRDIVSSAVFERIATVSESQSSGLEPPLLPLAATEVVNLRVAHAILLHVAPVQFIAPDEAGQLVDGGIAEARRWRDECVMLQTCAWTGPGLSSTVLRLVKRPWPRLLMPGVPLHRGVALGCAGYGGLRIMMDAMESAVFAVARLQAPIVASTTRCLLLFDRTLSLIVTCQQPMVRVSPVLLASIGFVLLHDYDGYDDGGSLGLGSTKATLQRTACLIFLSDDHGDFRQGSFLALSDSHTRDAAETMCGLSELLGRHRSSERGFLLGFVVVLRLEAFGDSDAGAARLLRSIAASLREAGVRRIRVKVACPAVTDARLGVLVEEAAAAPPPCLVGCDITLVPLVCSIVTPATSRATAAAMERRV